MPRTSHCAHCRCRFLPNPWVKRQQFCVSPDVFHLMVDRLGDFAVPYQHALETEADKRHMPLYLAGFLSHLDRKNAEEIAMYG